MSRYNHYQGYEATEAYQPRQPYSPHDLFEAPPSWSEYVWPQDPYEYPNYSSAEAEFAKGEHAYAQSKADMAASLFIENWGCEEWDNPAFCRDIETEEAYAYSQAVLDYDPAIHGYNG